MAEEGVWRTVGGRRIFIAKGQTLSQAMKSSGKFVKKKDDKKKENEDISFTSTITRKELMEKYGISEEERSAIRNYTSDGNYDINAYLREGGTIEDMKISMQETCERVDSTLNKLPKFDGTVYRKEPANMADTYKEGETYTNKGYTSTTAWPSISGLVVLEIKQSSGCNVSKLSCSPGENEVLLPRDFKYKVTKITKEGDYTRVYAKEVKDEDKK